MRSVLPRILAAICLLAATAAFANDEGPDRARFNNTGYVSLKDWAAENHLDARWLERDKTYLLTGKAKIAFTANSREANFDGVQLWLLFPMVNRSGAPFISQLDANASLRPLLSPSKIAAGRKLKIIALDAGHGGNDPGYLAGGRKEKDYTLRLAFELRDQLKKAGYKVVLTRPTDTKIDLPDRPGRAARGHADLFVSLHFNASEVDRANVQGAETYAMTPAGGGSTASSREVSNTRYPGNRADEKNVLLAHEIQKSLAAKLAVEDRGVRRARYAVLREATMPAVLIEAGFLSHPVEGKKIADAAYRKRMAAAIAEGIAGYKRVVER